MKKIVKRIARWVLRDELDNLQKDLKEVREDAEAYRQNIVVANREIERLRKIAFGSRKAYYPRLWYKR